MTSKAPDPADFLRERLPVHREWRRHLHKHPETAFNEHETSAFLVERLSAMGLEVAHGLAGTGVVATLKGRSPGPAIGLRADMDALPISETGVMAYRSVNAGTSHACGHDGHMTMLLAAADYLSGQADIGGTVHFVFQPAEEAAGGGRRMVEEGLFETFPVDRIFGLHNWPGLPLGQVAVQPGPMMAAMDLFSFHVHARGVHAAMPHLGTDAIVAAGALVGSLQTIVSRVTDPSRALVLSLTQIHGGESLNALPDHVELRGTLRYFDAETGATAQHRMRETAAGVARSHDVAIDFDVWPAYPVTRNDAAASRVMARAARLMPDAPPLVGQFAPSTASEDFAFMLQARPGAYAWIGNGRETALHNPAFDFNDDLIPIGARYWIEVARAALGQADATRIQAVSSSQGDDQ
ncbi:M20 aminoacylase family protein [Nitratireductor soli]|uniref:M20 aminoacylase family protein n=1 Tax=Nitratireductor soli TaxID=1670619 RepID=UPI00065DC794|nr:M20 aminoacylase family protein [Nitratireductor soli]